MKSRVSVTHTTGAEDVAVSFVTRAALLLSGVAIQSLLAYALLPAGRGEFAVCILFAGLFGVLLTPGAEAGAQHLVMAKAMDVSEAISVALVICVSAGFIGAGLAVPLISANVGFFGKADAESFYVAIALIPLTTFASASRHQLAALRRFRRLAIFSVVQTLVNVFALLFFVIALDLGVRGALIAACMGNLAMVFTCIGDLRRSAGLRWKTPSCHGGLRVVRYGLKYHIARIGGGIDARVGVLLMSLLAGRVEIGLFAVASGLMMRFITFSNAVFVPLLPRATVQGDGHPSLVAFCARMTLWTTAFSILVLLILGSPLVQFFFSSEFLPVVALIRIMAPGILVHSAASILTAYFRATDNPGICSWAVGLGLVCNASVASLLYPALGVDAAAWGMTIGFIVRSGLIVCAFVGATRIGPLLLLVPQRKDVRDIRSRVRQIIPRRGK